MGLLRWWLVALHASSTAAQELVVVSAANSRFGMKELAVMLLVRKKAEAEHLAVRLIAYDLGSMGTCLHKDGVQRPSGLWGKFGIEHRTFNFSRYPDHVAQLGCYAWKAPVILEVAEEVGSSAVVMWVDSGAAITSSLRSVVDATRANDGFISDMTSLSIARFSHETTLDYFTRRFGLQPKIADALAAARRQGVSRRQSQLPDGLDVPLGVPGNGDEALKYRNCNGAFSAHLYGGRRFETVSRKWLECSLDARCVCPKGSNRANHRQDQAALTLLAVMDDYVCGTHGKFVAAHGLGRPQSILASVGITSEKALFCPPSE